MSGGREGLPNRRRYFAASSNRKGKTRPKTNFIKINEIQAFLLIPIVDWKPLLFCSPLAEWSTNVKSFNPL
jgi:hypothetical protein